MISFPEKTSNCCAPSDHRRHQRYRSRRNPSRYAFRPRPRTVRLTFSPVRELGVHTICVVATELTELIETNEALRVSELSLRQLSARLLQLQDEERRRIARDLHDTTGQKIAVLSMTLDRLSNWSTTTQPTSGDALAESRDVVGKIGEEIRTLSYLLHPPLLDECGLASAVALVRRRLQKRSGIHLNVTYRRRSGPASHRCRNRSVSRCPGKPHQRASLLRQPQRGNSHLPIGNNVHLEIVDHGKGLESRPQNALPAGTPTLGVGIPGMRERIRQLGGQLDVEFRNGGTRVHASLPLAATLSRRTAHNRIRRLSRDQRAIRSATHASRRRHARKRILIADDHEVMRRGVRGLVESHEEWSVCGEALEGNEAVSKTRELRPDLLILDISMPGMSGIEAALQILKEDPMAKIIFFTMHDSPQIMREIANVGARGYVAKARAGNDLVDAVRAVLSGKTFFPRAAAS